MKYFILKIGALLINHQHRTQKYEKKDFFPPDISIKQILRKKNETSLRQFTRAFVDGEELAIIR
jgi:hypothetical protein